MKTSPERLATLRSIAADADPRLQDPYLGDLLSDLDEASANFECLLEAVACNDMGTFHARFEAMADRCLESIRARDTIRDAIRSEAEILAVRVGTAEGERDIARRDLNDAERTLEAVREELRRVAAQVSDARRDAEAMYDRAGHWRSVVSMLRRRLSDQAATIRGYEHAGDPQRNVTAGLLRVEQEGASYLYQRCASLADEKIALRKLLRRCEPWLDFAADSGEVDDVEDRRNLRDLRRDVEMEARNVEKPAKCATCDGTLAPYGSCPTCAAAEGIAKEGAPGTPGSEAPRCRMVRRGGDGDCHWDGCPEKAGVKCALPDCSCDDGPDFDCPVHYPAPAPLDPDTGAAILRHIGVEAALDRAYAEERNVPPANHFGIDEED